MFLLVEQCSGNAVVVCLWVDCWPLHLCNNPGQAVHTRSSLMLYYNLILPKERWCYLWLGGSPQAWWKVLVAYRRHYY